MALLANMIPEAVLSLLAGVVGGAAWIKLHRHDEYVPRAEFDLILAELRYIRERLDRMSEGG